MNVDVRYTIITEGQVRTDAEPSEAPEEITERVDKLLRQLHADSGMVAFSWSAEDGRFGGRTY